MTPIGQDFVPSDLHLAGPTIGLGRRSFLKLGALALGGLNLPSFLERQATAGMAKANVSVIQIYMGGGPSHIDMYDMKPNAPLEVRGEFRTIATALPGYRICEHLPYQSKVLDKLAIVRSVCHENGSHLPASHWMMTGHQPTPDTTTNKSPSIGSLVSRLRGPNDPSMPAYVSIPKRQLLGASAYLGPTHDPFTPDSDPSKADFSVANLQPPNGVTVPRLEDRMALLGSLDRIRRDLDHRGRLEDISKFQQRALEMVTNQRVQAAFDLSQEDPKTREMYGSFSVGQGCLLARRLVEAGVTFVTVLSGGAWDTHADNFSILKEDCLPRVDRAIAALVTDLYARGLDQEVMVVAYGEFGRTPVINKDAGRDHWPGANCVLFSGGGLKVGQMVGETDKIAAYPITTRYAPADVLATVFQFLKIDWHRELTDTRLNRKFPVLPGGHPIPELVS
jgi:hypothetical protein